MSFSGRDIRHFSDAGVSIGVDVSNNVARVTFCATNFKHGDKFSRPAARRLISCHFDGDEATLKSVNLTRRIISFPYEGDKPRTEIIGSLTKRISEELKLRAKTGGAAGSVVAIAQAIQEEAQERRAAMGLAEKAKHKN